MVKIKLTKEESQAQRQGWQVKEMVDSKGWQEVLLPFLEDKIHNSWVDPRQFKDDKEYAFANKTAWAWAQATQGIIDFIQKTQEESEALTRKEKGEVKNVLRESLS